MAEVNGCNRLTPVRSLAPKTGPLRASRRSAVPGVFMLISFRCGCSVLVVLRGGLVVAPSSIRPQGYASPFLARSHSP
ncbi:hypothetical protein QFZ44_000182 [Pantoea agglomerans]|nr:hypothetical protein [Pantoea agglomerans]